MSGFQFPEHWETSRLGEICSILDAQRIPINSTERNKRIAGKSDADLFPYYGATGRVGWIDGYLFNGEFVLVGEDGAPFMEPHKGVSYLVSGKFWVNNHAHIIAHPTSNVFLCYYLRQINYSTFVTGTTRLKLNQAELRRIPVPLPPLNEQKRIVAKIEELFSELDAGEESLRKARRQLGVYRQSLLKQAFEGKLTAAWRKQNPHLLESSDQLLARIQAEREGRYKQQVKEWRKAVKRWDEAGRKNGRRPAKPRVPKKVRELDGEVRSVLADLPSEWFWAALGLMTPGVEYGTAAKSQEEGEFPVIRMGNLQQGEIDWDKLVFTSDADEINRYRLQPGDVLFNRTNSPELVGKTAVYRGTRPAIFAGYLIRVNQVARFVDSGYLNYFLNSHTAKRYGSTVKTDGVNQSNINGAKLCSYPFPYCSLPEQQEIVRILDEQFTVIEQNEWEIDAALKRSEALRQSILKKAFSGQLVAQDPADEPASVLLERIRAEREAGKASPRKVARRRPSGTGRLTPAKTP